jgi:hypothetical protein
VSVTGLVPPNWRDQHGSITREHVLTNEGVLEVDAALSSGLAPNWKEPIGAAFLAAGSAALEAPPKLNDPKLAAGLSAFPVVSAGLAPKLKDPSGAVAGLSAAGAGAAAGLPNENGVSAFAGSVAAGLGTPKENGVGAATTGVEDPEVGADFRPKKSGTSPDSLAGAAGAGAGAEGLPSPKANGAFFEASLEPELEAGPPNSGAG